MLLRPKNSGYFEQCLKQPFPGSDDAAAAAVAFVVALVVVAAAVIASSVVASLPDELV